MCDFIRKEKNNMNKCCIPKYRMLKECIMCDFIRIKKINLNRNMCDFIRKEEKLYEQMWCMIEVVSMGLERVTEDHMGMGRIITKIKDILKG